MKTMFNDKTILITGGTGSFGKAFTKILLRSYKPKKLIIFSRDELKQYEMAQVFSRDIFPCLRFFIGDVRDKERLHRALNGVDFIIHAAALKQVPAAEYNPFEAVKTNIIGAQNVINVALDHGVKKIIALSSDKATSPANLYGATKLCSDKLFVAANSYVTRDDSRLSVVRYGNVIGSRGSVIPLFLKQRETGKLSITDTRMTRFWLSLEQSANFVMQCLEKMVGGEIFVPKIPSMNIMDLAKAVCSECKTQIIGIRSGEKLHETLITNDDAPNTIEFSDHYVVKPAFHFFQRRFCEDGCRPVPEDFEYNSYTNPWKLSVDKMREILKGL